MNEDDAAARHEIVERRISRAMDAMFPHGAGRAPHTRVRHHLDQVAQVAFREGQAYALLGLMTAADVADEFGVSLRRARALIKNRHERFGSGAKLGNRWLIHRDELPSLAPETKYRRAD